MFVRGCGVAKEPKYTPILLQVSKSSYQVTPWFTKVVTMPLLSVANTSTWQNFVMVLAGAMFISRADKGTAGKPKL